MTDESKGRASNGPIDGSDAVADGLLLIAAFRRIDNPSDRRKVIELATVLAERAPPR